MSLPDVIRVKLSSEGADTISVTQVVVEEMATRDLLERILAVTGKDAPRIHDILRRGTLVSGASRFRWNGWDADAALIEEALRAFPDPDPARPFDASRCVRVVLTAAAHKVEIARRAASETRFLGRRHFWGALMDAVPREALEYRGYSYRERGDWYHAALAAAASESLRRDAVLLRYSALERQVRAARWDALDLLAGR